MKGIVSFTICLILLCSFTIPSYASPIVSTTSLESPVNDYDWPQGLTVAGDTYYVLDGNQIKAGKQGKWQTVFELGSLKGLLPDELQDDMVIRSFRLAEMKERGGSLYLSGLIYKDRQGQGVEYPSGGLSIGETYTILFKVDSGKAHILYLESVALNREIQPGNFYETQSGGPENLYKWGPNLMLFDYAKYIYRPNFTFMDNGDILMVRRYYSENESYPYLQVVQISGDKVKMQYELKNKKTLIRGNREQGKWPNYVIATMDKGTLTIYDGVAYMYYVDLKTKKVKVDELLDTYFLERPVYFNHQMYFLNDDGVFTWKRQGQYYDYYDLLTAKEFKLPVLISDWDYDGKFIYLLSYDNRNIYKIKPYTREE